MGLLRRASHGPSVPPPPVRADVRHAYLGWLRSSLPLVAVTLVAIALQQALIAAEVGAAPDAPPPLRGMLIALAAGSVIFGRSFKARPLQLPAGQSLEQAVRTARSASFTLLGFAVAPVVMGVVVVLISRSIVDLYMMLAITLLGFMTLYPRVEQWDAWIRHLTVDPSSGSSDNGEA